MKSLFFVALFLLSTIAWSQSHQVQNAYNYLQEKDYRKAKIAADTAIKNAESMKAPKLWFYRAKIYKGIYEDKTDAIKNLDADAVEKALESILMCLKLDKGANNFKDQAKGLIVQISFTAFEKAKYNITPTNYTKALSILDMVEKSLDYDFEGGMKRNNISKELVLYYRYRVNLASGNKDMIVASVKQLMDIKYKEPTIYTDMVSYFINQKDTATALTYLTIGREQFEDNINLMNVELSIYLKQGKIAILKDKLIKAIEVSPENDLFHCVLGNIYNSTKEQDKAVESFKKALEINPELENANYGLGALYFSRGKGLMDKAGALPVSENKKAIEIEAKAKDEFKLAAPYLEKSFELSPDAAVKRTLFQLFSILGDTEKAAKYTKTKPAK